MNLPQRMFGHILYTNAINASTVHVHTVQADIFIIFENQYLGDKFLRTEKISEILPWYRKSYLTCIHATCILSRT